MLIIDLKLKTTNKRELHAELLRINSRITVLRSGLKFDIPKENQEEFKRLSASREFILEELKK